MRAYRRFVEAGLAEPPANPFVDAWDGWLLGSERFIQRIKSRFGGSHPAPSLRQGRRLASPDPATVIAAVAKHYGVLVEDYCQRRSAAAGRDLAAHMAHRRTTAPLGELATAFGLTHPDSVSNLIRRAEKKLAGSPKERKDAKHIWDALLKTENRI